MKPIPEYATLADPLWELAVKGLAHGLVMEGAKGKIIERFTGLSHRKVRDLYRGLRGETPPAGPLVQGSPRYFAVPTRYTAAGWNIQATILLECYERLGRITTVRVKRGWRLLVAHRAYIGLTEKLAQDVQPMKRLDINQAYALLTYCGFLTAHARADLQRRTCSQCSMLYLVVAGAGPKSQRCPVCTMETNLKRLFANLKQFSKKPMSHPLGESEALARYSEGSALSTSNPPMFCPH